MYNIYVYIQIDNELTQLLKLARLNELFKMLKIKFLVNFLFLKFFSNLIRN